MKILQISKPVLPIKIDMKYGGIERVIRDLDEEFVRMGHDSYVVAPADSVIKGKLIPSTKNGAWNNHGGIFYNENQKQKALKIHTSVAIDAINQIMPDAIHDHLPLIMQEQYLKSGLKNPMLTTLHGSLHSENGMSSIPNPTPSVIYSYNHFNSISESQRSFFSELIPVEFNVYNSIRVDDYPYQEEKRDYLLSLGKIGINKGQDTAIKVARDLGEKLVIAGPIHAFRGPIKDFWKKKVKPFIDEFYLDIPTNQINQFTKEFSEKNYGKKGRVVYVGEVNDNQKKEWFKYSKCFLMPIRWHEPFGLVMIEAMATGTPVVSYNLGAVSEIIVHGRTGFVIPAENYKSFRDSIKLISSIKPEDCRGHVKYNFDIKKQAKKYIEIFKHIMN
ncbi:glycosyltransferase [Candidatus Pacearchaeota archaeon]|nr:glycosyltransferase [Candidatus Pacearchaeota archaeon]MBI2056794.1 glycosyltransferase [Candidatus Pacearchaeota archaeon]